MFRKPESARSMKFFREACYYRVLELNEKERNHVGTRGDENSEGRFAELAIFQLKGPPETVETEKIAFLGAGEGHPSS